MAVEMEIQVGSDRKQKMRQITWGSGEAVELRSWGMVILRASVSLCSELASLLLLFLGDVLLLET